MLATLTLFGGLPTASVLESSGGINGYIQTNAGQAILKRAGFAIRSPIGAASAAVGGGLAVLFLQPKDNPFTDADDDVLLPDPFGGNGPDDDKPPLLIPAPDIDGSEALDEDGNPIVTVPDIDQQQQDEEFARNANLKIPAGQTDDGEQIFRDGHGNRFIEVNGRKVNVDSNGKPFDGQVERGALTDIEFEQANKIVRLKGGIFVGNSVANAPGIDGTLNGVPVSLKGTNSTNPDSVTREARRARESAANAGLSDVEVYIDAPNLTKSDIENNPNFEQLKSIPKGTIKEITVITKDGPIVIRSEG